MYIDSIKKRPRSERSGDFGQLNLLRKQRIRRRTNKLENLFHTELVTGKEVQDINYKRFDSESVTDIEVIFWLRRNELNKFIR